MVVANESCDHMLFYGLHRKDYNIIWNVVDTLMFLPTVLGNLLILISIAKFRKLRTKIHILIGHLAFNDFFVGATLLPLETIGDVTGLDRMKYYCLMKTCVFSLTLGGSCMGLLLISVERFSAVAFPLQHAFFTKQKLYIVLVFSWLYVLFWTLAPVFGCNTLHGHLQGDMKCNPSIIWGTWCKLGMNINFVVSLILNVILYLCVVNIAVKRAREHGRQTGTRTNLFKLREMSKTVTMAFVLGLFALFWLPYATLTFLITLQTRCIETFYSIRRWCLLLGLFNCSINWLIYGLKNRDFRTAFKHILCRNQNSSGTIFRRSRRVACSTTQGSGQTFETDC